jgi:hypothetical protein
LDTNAEFIIVAFPSPPAKYSGNDISEKNPYEEGSLTVCLLRNVYSCRFKYAPRQNDCSEDQGHFLILCNFHGGTDYNN